MDQSDITKFTNSITFLVKFDAGILVLLGTVVTLLKLDRIEIIEGINEVKVLLIIVVFLILYGLFVERYVVLLDYKNLSETELIKSRRLISRFMVLQLTFHFFLFGFMTGYTISWIDNYLIISKQNEAADELHNIINKYLDDNSRLPFDLNDLVKYDKLLLNNIKQIGVEYEIIQNPYGPHDKIDQAMEVIADKIYNQLILKEISDSSIFSNYENLLKRIPEVYNSLEGDSINIGLDFEYIIVMPGLDLQLHSNDDRVFRYTTVVVTPIKFESIFDEEIMSIIKKKLKIK